MIDITKQYEVGFRITQSKTSNYAKNEVTGQLENLIITVQQLLRKKEEKAYLYQNFEGNKYYRCEGSEHFARDCMSEKRCSHYGTNGKETRNNLTIITTSTIIIKLAVGGYTREKLTMLKKT